MSLGIAFKGAEGIVLAADSRVMLMALAAGNPVIPGLPEQYLLQASFDNATKLLEIKSQRNVGVVTYGRGVIGERTPRTASSFLPEFEKELENELKDDNGELKRLPVKEFADRFAKFFMRQWKDSGMPDSIPLGQDMIFLVGGYDPDAAYGRIFEIYIPNRPAPNEMIPNDFGVVWGGQRDITDRIIQGFDANLPNMVQDILNIPIEKRDPELELKLKSKLQVAIPWQFLPLQDCIDLAIFLVKTTVNLQRWLVGIRGVGGMVEVATITRTKGFDAIQQKRISGEASERIT